VRTYTGERERQGGEGGGERRGEREEGGGRGGCFKQLFLHLSKLLLPRYCTLQSHGYKIV